MKYLVFVSFFMLSLNGFSQDTLVLKITNMKPFYELCTNHWTPCETVLEGIALYSAGSGKRYVIHVPSNQVLNRVARNPASVYQVIVRKRYYAGPFEKSGDEAYSLIDIRSAY